MILYADEMLFAGVTVIVLTRPKMRSSTNTYLTALAIADLLYLIFVFTISLGHYPGIHSPNFYYYWQYHRIGIWLIDATGEASGTFPMYRKLTAISFQRPCRSP